MKNRSLRIIIKKIGFRIVYFELYLFLFTKNDEIPFQLWKIPIRGCISIVGNADNRRIYLYTLQYCYPNLKEYKDIEFAEVEYQLYRMHYIYFRIKIKATNLLFQLSSRERYLQRLQLKDIESSIYIKQKFARKLESNKDRLTEWRSGASNYFLILE
ncbi:hypothetical protein EAF04_009504 [Stromatinia cepivora]|nr:hypothetical protein EAF04_009504 [Stromatinia cepivora]